MEHSEAADTMAVERYLLGEMTPEDRDAFEEHFFGCGECAAAVRDGDAMAAAIRNDAAIPAMRRKNRLPFWTASAAVLVMVLAGVPALQNVRLQRELDASRAPRIVDSYSLLDTGVRGGEQVTIASAARPFTIAFDVPPQPGARAYVVRVVDTAGKEHLNARISIDAARDTQQLFFPAASLPPGAYSIEVQADPSSLPASKLSFEVRP